MSGVLVHTLIVAAAGFFGVHAIYAFAKDRLLETVTHTVACVTVFYFAAGAPTAPVPWPLVAAFAAASTLVVCLYRRELASAPTPPPEAEVTPAAWYLEPLEQDS